MISVRIESANQKNKNLDELKSFEIHIHFDDSINSRWNISNEISRTSGVHVLCTNLLSE